MTKSEQSTGLGVVGVAGWQPIETAPKDGTEIIGIFSNDYGYQEKPTVYGPYTVRFRNGDWVSSWDGGMVIRSQSDFGTEYEDPMPPTHWMPLPAPPSMTPEPGREALAAIVAGLEGVTPGKWRSSETEPPGQACIHSKGSPYQIATAWNGRENFPYRKNAAHIARCHPEAIRSIADYVAKVEARATTAEARAEAAEERVAVLEGIGSAHDLINDWIVAGTEDLPDDTGVTIKIGTRSIILDELGNLRRACSLKRDTQNADQ